MLENVNVELNGIVVNPGDVLVVTIPGATHARCDEVSKALEDVGLSGRAVVIGADGAQLATVPRDE